jgi:hypothetical protein
MVKRKLKTKRYKKKTKNFPPNITDNPRTIKISNLILHPNSNLLISQFLKPSSPPLPSQHYEEYKEIAQLASQLSETSNIAQALRLAKHDTPSASFKKNQTAWRTATQM